MRPVEINERLLAVVCMGVGTSVHRRYSRELLVSVKKGECVVLTPMSTESYGFYADIDCKQNDCVLSVRFVSHFLNYCTSFGEIWYFFILKVVG
jgi:hypothetical protein